MRHLRLLVAAAYGVLTFDARGHGRSGGQTNALGWVADPDVAGAVGFLGTQPGVDPDRIAALGFSMGAEEALRAAADGSPTRSRGRRRRRLDPRRHATHRPRGLCAGHTLRVLARISGGPSLVSGENEPRPLKDLVGRIRVPVLLIASGYPGERKVDETFRSRIGDNAALWYVPDAGHEGAGRAPAGLCVARVGVPGYGLAMR